MIIPSLPGYGFSDPPVKDGCDSLEIAGMFHKLMTTLGYNKYSKLLLINVERHMFFFLLTMYVHAIVVYGTDWGSMIGRYMSMNYPDHVVGHITNMPLAMPPLPTFQNLIHYPMAVLMFIIAIFLGFDKVYGKDNTKNMSKFSFANCEKDDGAGYRAIQSTRPYTIAFSLTDSPVGLLSWLLEAYHSWGYFPSREAAQTSTLPVTITTDEFLTQVTIYWMTNTMSSSIRIYYEAMKDNMSKLRQLSSRRLSVPYAVSYFEKENLIVRSQLDNYHIYRDSNAFLK